MFLLLFVVFPAALLGLIGWACASKRLSLRTALCFLAAVLAVLVNLGWSFALVAAYMGCGDAGPSCKPDPAWARQQSMLSLPLSLIPDASAVFGFTGLFLNAALWGGLTLSSLRMLTRPRRRLAGTDSDKTGL